MNKKIIIEAPAKINLYLLVLNKLFNGYHELESLMAKINLKDYLTIELNTEKDCLILKNNTGQILDKGLSLEHNLCFQAVQAFRAEGKLRSKFVKINLEKNIPFGAGLGGASSNAAAVLLALNSFLTEKEKLNQQTLNNIALKLGADVPFFLNKETFLVAQGVGEKLTPINLKAFFKDKYFLLIFFKDKLSTKDVFENFSLTNNTLGTNIKKIMFDGYNESPEDEKQKFLLNNVLPKIGLNHLLESAFNLNKKLKEVESIIKKTKPYKFSLSGSGPSFWLCFTEKNKFEDAFSFLKKELAEKEILEIKFEYFL